MRVISYRRLREFSEQHAGSRDALDNWFKVAKKANWSNLVEVQSVFPKAEAVGNFTVFNIKGNRYRGKTSERDMRGNLDNFAVFSV